MSFKEGIQIFAAICTILGISVWGIFIFVMDHETPSNTEQPSSTELTTEYGTVAIPTTESTKVEIRTEQQVPPIVVVAEPLSDQNNTENVKREARCIDSISLAERSRDSDVVESFKDNENDEVAEDIELDNTETTPKSYAINIDTPGKLFFMSNDDLGENGSVDILYSFDESDLETNNIDEQDMQSHDLVDIVNTNNSEDDQQIKYMSVVPGVYVFNFIDCDFENISIYLDDDTDQIADESYGELYDGTDELSQINEYIDIPLQNVITVQISEDNMVYRMKSLSQDDFLPIFRFYSKNNIDGTLTILDEFGNELQTIELYEEEDNSTQNIEGTFNFEAGKEYYIEITSSRYEDLSEYIYYLQIINPNIVNEDDGL